MPLPQDAIQYEPMLFAIAYRMTGEVMTSQDIVQDVLLMWLSRMPESVQDLKAYLAKSVVNASLNHLAQVKCQRQAYVGTWLPEPVLTSQPMIEAKLDISFGLILILEKLSPTERAVFILKESFDLAYPELAQLFEITETNCRQLYHRAKEKVAAPPRRFPLDSQRQQALLQAFTRGSETGDIDSLIDLLKSDVVLYTDGGGKVPAAVKPLVGAVTVAAFLRSLNQKYGSQLSTRPALVNGELALLLTQKENQLLTTVMVIETDSVGITGIYSVRNPEKLMHLQ